MSAALDAIVRTIAGAATTFAVLAILFVPLERVFPARKAQRIARPGAALDVCFFLGQHLVFAAAAFAVIAFVGRLAGGVLPVSLRASVASSPAWLQVIGAVVLGDVIVYWFHRACHRFELLWRFHEVHHSAEHLDWIAAHREHPFDGIATQLCMNLPAIALGVRIELLAGVAVFRGAWAIYVHSNTRLPLGPLRMLLGAPELHHWHHARLDRTAHNFANLAPWLDWIFGTYHLPEVDQRGERFELGLTEPAPASYFALLARPFTPRRSANATASIAIARALHDPQGFEPRVAPASGGGALPLPLPIAPPASSCDVPPPAS